MDTVLEVMVDWAATDWRATPTFSGIDDISADIINISSARGKEKEVGNNPSGTIDIELRNHWGNTIQEIQQVFYILMYVLGCL